MKNVSTEPRYYFCVYAIGNEMCRKLKEFYQHRRYGINKFLLCLNGQWPYQEERIRVFAITVTMIVSIGALPAQFRRVTVDRNDWSSIIAAVGPILLHSGCMIKLLNSVLYADKLRMLLERVYDDWHAPMGPEEDILTDFADNGRYFTVIYTVWLYTSISAFLVLSNVPRIMMTYGWGNVTSASVFVIPVYYTKYDEEYWNYIQIYLSIGILVVLSALVAVDGMFVVFIQHGCGIFAMVGYRLENLIQSEDLAFDIHPHRMADKTFWIVIDCIKRHKAAIE